jgi:predicted transcriptional regulator
VAKSRGRSRAPLGRAELELLQFVDQNPGVSVGDAAAQFGAPRGLARTTVLTTMQRLVSKGYLTRKSVDSVYRYRTRVPATRALKELVADFVRGVLGGSVTPFVAFLNEHPGLTDEEVGALRQLVQGLDQKPRGERPAPSEEGKDGGHGA